MTNSLRAWALVSGVAVAASSASAAVIVESRHSLLSASAFCGNGPESVSYSDSAEEFGIFSSAPLEIDHLTEFAHSFWGASDARTVLSQNMEFADNSPSGFAFEGSIGVDSSLARSIAPSQLGADALAQCSTDNSLDYRFTVTEPTEWLIHVNASRNPTADFAVSLRDVNGGFVYLSPLVAPFTGIGGGVLQPGTYEFHARANTFASSGDPAMAGYDEASNLFALLVGTVPTPGAGALVCLAAIGAGRRQR